MMVVVGGCKNFIEFDVKTIQQELARRLQLISKTWNMTKMDERNSPSDERLVGLNTRTNMYKLYETL